MSLLASRSSVRNEIGQQRDRRAGKVRHTVRQAGADEVPRAIVEHSEDEADNEGGEHLLQRCPQRLVGQIDEVVQAEQDCADYRSPLYPPALAPCRATERRLNQSTKEQLL